MSRKPSKPAKGAAKKPAKPPKQFAPPADPKRKRGRPTDFKPEYCEQVEKLCKLGATDVEIADFFGKAQSTIDLWKLRHREFSESIKKGKIPADAEIAHSLHARATGFEWDEQQAIKVKEVIYGDNGKRLKEIERVEIVNVHRVTPPDTGAAIFWLCNRRKEQWRQRQEITGANGKPLGGDVNLDEVRDAINSKFDRIAATLAARGIPRQPDGSGA